MLSKHDPFHKGMGGWGELNMHPSQKQQGLHCEAPADRHPICAVENSTVTQCSLEPVRSLMRIHAHTDTHMQCVCCLPYCINYGEGPEYKVS